MLASAVTLLIYVIASARFVTSSSNVNRSESDVIKPLLVGYDPYTRPRRDMQQPVDVRFQVFVVYLKDFTWKDDYLSWTRLPGDPPYITVPSALLWTPDIAVRNSIHDVYTEVTNVDKKFRARIFSDGTIMLVTAGDITVSCLVDMTYFPYDHQSCYIHIDSWTYSAKEMRLIAANPKNESLNLNWAYYVDNAQWSIENSTIMFRLAGDADYYIVHVLVWLARKPRYHMFTVMAPCCLMSLLVALVFLLPPDAGEKVSLCVTVLLSFTVFQLILLDTMPKSSDFTPILGMYFLAVMVLASLCLTCTTLVLNLHHHPGTSRPPPALRCVLYSCLPRAIGLTKRQLQPVNRQDVPSNTTPSHVTGQSEAQTENGATHQHKVQPAWPEDEEVGREEWIHLARVVDRLFLFIFLILIILTTGTILGLLPYGAPTNSWPRGYDQP